MITASESDGCSLDRHRVMAVVQRQRGFVMRFVVLVAAIVVLAGCERAGNSTGTAESASRGGQDESWGGITTDPQSVRWDGQHTQKPLTISEDGLTLSWDTDS